MKDIYELELHDVIVISETTNNHPTPTKTTVTRVPGGWIYKTYQSTQVGDQIALSATSVFVPYNTEFKTESSQNFIEPSIG